MKIEVIQISSSWLKFGYYKGDKNLKMRLKYDLLEIHNFEYNLKGKYLRIKKVKKSIVSY
jgi:hypothetical protein